MPLRNKTPLHHWIFWTLILFLPTQLGKHFWPDFAFIFGIRVDYLSPTFYFTDIIFLVLIFSWIVETKALREIPKRVEEVKNNKTPLSNCLIIYLSIYLLANAILVAQNQGVAVYKLAKLLEMFVLGLYIYKNHTNILSSLFWRISLSLAAIYPAALALLQFVLQRPLGDLFWWLGERTFSSGDPGIALLTINGQELMRPYATFSHPNSLAGFLLIILILLFPWKKMIEKTALIFGVGAIILSWSQAVWITAIVLFSLWVLRQRRIFLIGAGSILLFITAISAAMVFVGTAQLPFNTSEDVSLRLSLAQTAKEMVGGNPLFGIGLNNFIGHLPQVSLLPQVSWWLQPVHNIFLLVLAETGFIGIVFLFWFLWKSLENLKLVEWNLRPYYPAFLAILFTGLLDHYWLTLQQNQLLASIVFGLVLARSSRP
ncbi:hypothetical protein CMO96_04435 [Candidatus Woesebacteria bacterium]|nr:hypothetical protein [Candidatus Woesebacteria bacterium]|tara:strand:- start:1919 stop:3205 length:1287 start_codon:yes stop_codon:yes gene_type:complete